jgi:hypothetical protein
MLFVRRKSAGRNEAAKTCWACILETERIFSMQRDIAGLRGTRFDLPSLEAILRKYAGINLTTQIRTSYHQDE